MSVSSGIADKCISDSPIAVVDFETTGLTPGVDRVVEVSVVRLNPGEVPQLVLDSLVNPMRPVAATEIHGITDADVANAPTFKEIAGDLIAALADCVVSAYNVYFDIKFLAYELGQVGVDQEPPHFCLMYMRPLLGLGARCRLEEACRVHDIEYEPKHVAALDAEACGTLLQYYLNILQERSIVTYAELAALKSYKFLGSFNNDPLPNPELFDLMPSNRFYSRLKEISAIPVDVARQALGTYWDALRTVLANLEITEEELEYVTSERERLGLKEEQVRVLHARAFANAIAQFTEDQWLDDQEVVKLRRLNKCLSRLGWAPGE